MLCPVSVVVVGPLLFGGCGGGRGHAVSAGGGAPVSRNPLLRRRRRRRRRGCFVTATTPAGGAAQCRRSQLVGIVVHGAHLSHESLTPRPQCHLSVIPNGYCARYLLDLDISALLSHSPTRFYKLPPSLSRSNIQRY